MNIHPNLTPPKPVILNLFQDPSGRKRDALGTGTKPTGWLANARSLSDEKWVLKQVQDDEVGKNEAGRVALRG